MSGFSSIRSRPGWVAIVAQKQCITLAHVVRRPGARPELCRLESFAVDSTEVAALRRLRSVWRLKAHACTTLMPAAAYQITQLDAPQVPREERNGALRWALKDIVDYPLELACVDSLDLPLALRDRPPAVFAISAAEARVRARAEAFEQAGVPLQAIDVAELAQRNVAALLEEENRGLAFLRVDNDGGCLTLNFASDLLAVRAIDVSAADLVASEGEERLHLIERLVLEVQRSLDFFDRQYSAISVSKLVFAMCPRIKGLAAQLAGSIEVPMSEMDLGSVLDFPALPELRDPQYQARNVLAIGAALRGEPTQVLAAAAAGAA